MVTEFINPASYKPFADSKFLESYNKTLLTFEEEINKGAYKQEIDQLEQQIMDYLKFEKPDYKPFPPKKLGKRLSFLKNNPITPSDERYLKSNINARKLVDKPLVISLTTWCLKIGH